MDSEIAVIYFAPIDDSSEVAKMSTTRITQIYDAIVKIISAAFAFIGFCLLSAGIRWQFVMNDFLLAQDY